MRILVTGGAGFIGSNLVDNFQRQDFEVDVVDDLSNGYSAFVPPAIIADDRLLVMDFASDAVLDRIRERCYDVVVHLAAQPRVSYSVERPFETHMTNVESTLRLVDACRGNIQRFVFASSSAVYGDVVSLPTKESDEKRYRSPYALHKLTVEEYLRLYGSLYDFDSVSLRFFNVFGPRQMGGSPYSTAVSAWINAIMKDQPMRSDGDGSQSRDMCHVSNVVDACHRAATSKKSFRGEAYNVGCGASMTNKEILDYLKSKFPSAKHHDAPWRAGDVMHTLADITAIKESLGYSPVAHFWEGLDSTIQWYQENWKLICDLSAD